MTARESVKNYPSALREMTNYSVRGIKKVCKEAGAHPAGSEESKKAKAILKQELNDCCDTVKEETFKAKPNITLFLIFGAVSLVLGIALTVAKQFAAGGFFAGLGVVLLVLPFILFKSVDAVNLYGIKNPTEKALRRIVLLANSDSSKKSEGAGNNLSGCYSALSVVRFMQRQQLSLKNTEIWIVLTDADNINLSGTKSFCASHDFSDIETVFVSLSCIVNPEEISAFYSDDNAKAIIEGAAGRTEKTLKATQNAPESKIAAKTNAHFAAVTAFSKDDLKKEDKAENLNLRAIEAVVDILLESVFSLDK